MTATDPQLAAKPAARFATAAEALAAPPGGGGPRMTKHDISGGPHDKT